jgi:hypothetical protein
MRTATDWGNSRAESGSHCSADFQSAVSPISQSAGAGPPTGAQSALRACFRMPNAAWASRFGVPPSGIVITHKCACRALANRMVTVANPVRGGLFIDKDRHEDSPFLFCRRGNRAVPLLEPVAAAPAKQKRRIRGWGYGSINRPPLARIFHTPVRD